MINTRNLKDGKGTQSMSSASLNPETPIEHQLKEVNTAYTQLKAAIHQRIIGQEETVEHLLVTLFSGGHALFVGVPGLAKTLLVSTLAESLGLNFNRIQFTPDLMPADITGSEILNVGDDGRRTMEFRQGPVFTNILLADEINRTPPKTQAALLQAMQERSVTAGGQTYQLTPPFHVFATQNPVEQEGTYPLPEAQLDRFTMMIELDYPMESDEVEIIRSTTQRERGPVSAVLNSSALETIQAFIREIPVADHLLEKTVKLVRSTRPSDPHAPSFIKDFIEYGAGPRAGQHIILAAKARAALRGNPTVDLEDLAALAKPILRHRLILNFKARAQGQSVDNLIDQLLTTL